MKLTYKMKVKLSLLVAFVFIIALIIHEDHASVILKKFKPRRTTLTETKPDINSSISAKTTSKQQVKAKNHKKTWTAIKGEVSNIKNSTSINNETVVKLKTINRDLLLNSSVIYDIPSVAVSNSSTSKLSRSLSVENVTSNDSNCSKSRFSENEKDQNCSITDISSLSNISAEISEIKESLSQDLLQEINNVVQDLSSVNSEIPVSNETFSSDSVVLKQEKPKLTDNRTRIIVTDNRTADQPRDGNQLNTALKQRSKIESASNFSQQSVSDNLNLTNVNIQDFKIIADDSSAIKLVNESEILKKKDDGSASENILPNETLLQTNQETSSTSSASLALSADSEVVKHDSSVSPLVDESEIIQRDDSSVSKNISTSDILNLTGPESAVSAGLDSSAHSEESKKDSSLMQIVNESEILQDTNDSSSSENISTNESFLNQSGLESIVSAGLDFLAQSEVAKNAAVAMEIFNLSDSSLTDHIIDENVMDLVLPSLPTQDDLVKETAPSEINNTKNDLIPNNKVNESHAITDTAESDLDVLPVNKKKCPPPGICVFWFMARNTCTDDSQCLDSKICCRVRCSKKCIDV